MNLLTGLQRRFEFRQINHRNYCAEVEQLPLDRRKVHLSRSHVDYDQQ